MPHRAIAAVVALSAFMSVANGAAEAQRLLTATSSGPEAPHDVDRETVRPPQRFAGLTAGPSQTQTSIGSQSTRPRLSLDPPEEELVVPGPVSIPLLEKWLTAVERHVPGAADDSIAELASLRQGDLQQLVFHLKTVVTLMRAPDANLTFQRVRGSLRPVQSQYTGTELKQLQALARRAAQLGELSLLTRGAWLHTDLVIRGAETRSERANTLSERIFVRMNDGRQVGAAREMAGHLETARALLGYLRPTESIAAAVRLWYRATAAYLQREFELDTRHIHQAVELFPRDAELLLLAGALHEAYAAGKVQEVVGTANLPFGVTLDIGSPRSELRLAEGLLRRALRIDPSLTEARIRLGNVLGGLGRHRDAAIELRPTPDETGEDSLLAYYARMLLGRELEELGDLDQARALYEQATRLYPHAQSALMALSQAARRAGDDVAADQALERAFQATLGRDDRDDPWWLYANNAGRFADRLLTDARESLMNQPRK